MSFSQVEGEGRKAVIDRKVLRVCLVSTEKLELSISPVRIIYRSKIAALVIFKLNDFFFVLFCFPLSRAFSGHKGLNLHICYTIVPATKGHR